MPDHHRLIWYADNLGTQDLVLIVAKEKPEILLAPFLVLSITVTIILVLGLWAQQRFLGRHFLGPVLQLVESVGNQGKVTGSDHWPIELKNLNLKLSRLLSERDAATKKAAIATLEKGKETDYASFAHTLLHAIKKKLINIRDIVNIDPQIPDTTKAFIIEVIETPQFIIQRALKDYAQRSMVKSTAEINITSNEHSKVSSISYVIAAVNKEFNNLAAIKLMNFSLNYSRPLLSSFCNLSSHELYCAVQNVVSNAFDSAAESKKKEIIVSFDLLSSDGQRFCEILVRDSGPPFSPAAFEAIEEGRSYTSKKNGNGFGLCTAKATIEKIGGDFTISRFEKTVRLKIPLVIKPDWIFDIRKITGEIIILDDDNTILEKVRKNLTFTYPEAITLFTSESEFLTAARMNSKAQLLIDFDYAGSRDGFTLIQEEELKERAVLLSGLIPSDIALLKRAIKANVRMYPKESLMLIDG